MVETPAMGIVVLYGVYLCALAAVSILAPSRANRFLLGFAGSRQAHFLELLTRLVVGGAFLVHAPNMLVPRLFGIFGWVLVGTTACLLVLPWRWHRRFARYAVPRATRHLGLIGVCSLALGIFILVAVFRGNAA